MARMSLETRKRVITLYSRGHTVSEIQASRLREENFIISSLNYNNLLSTVAAKT